MDVRSVKNTNSSAPDEYVEAIRQKIGTGFSDQKATGKKRNEMGKDDFIKLMSAQLKHQDPMSPMKNEAMAAQLAQFSSLEQMVNVNTNLEKMTAAQKPAENVLAASLIGKRVMTDSSKFLLQKGAQPEMKFDLPADAQTVNVSVVDAKGEIIREFELGTMAKGAQSIRWDGKNGKNQDAVPGEFTYRVNAADISNKQLKVENTTSGLVSGVSFEGGKALLLVDGKKIPMDSVGRIEADTSGANSVTETKQNIPTTAGGVPENKNDTADKNSLPQGLSAEKIKSMLGALGASSRMDVGPEANPADVVEENSPMPLWNPNL
jgi:flagellar basal-body rod modification protein FlgD